MPPQTRPGDKNDEETRPDEERDPGLGVLAAPPPLPRPDPIDPDTRRDYTVAQGSPRSGTAQAGAAIRAGQLLRTTTPGPAVAPWPAGSYARVVPADVAGNAGFVGVAAHDAATGDLVTVLSGGGVQHLSLAAGAVTLLANGTVVVSCGANGELVSGAGTGAIGVALSSVTATEADGTAAGLNGRRIPVRWQATK